MTPDSIESALARVQAIDAELVRLERSFREEWCGTLILAKMTRLEKERRRLMGARAIQRRLIAEAVQASDLILIQSKP